MMVKIEGFDVEGLSLQFAPVLVNFCMAFHLSSAGLPKLPMRTILWTGLLAGSLDIGAALLTYWIRTGKDPLLVLKFVASGVFGMEAFSGGGKMYLYGLLFHYLISLFFTFLFFLLVARFRPALVWPVVTGIVYGMVVWALMNLVVLPASRTPESTSSPLQTLIGMLTIVFMVGLPIALAASWYDQRRRQSFPHINIKSNSL